MHGAKGRGVRPAREKPLSAAGAKATTTVFTKKKGHLFGKKARLNR